MAPTKQFFPGAIWWWRASGVRVSSDTERRNRTQRVENINTGDDDGKCRYNVRVRMDGRERAENRTQIGQPKQLIRVELGFCLSKLVFVFLVFVSRYFGSFVCRHFVVALQIA